MAEPLVPHCCGERVKIMLHCESGGFWVRWGLHTGNVEVGVGDFGIILENTAGVRGGEVRFEVPISVAD